jgi:hypothetical protein
MYLLSIHVIERIHSLFKTTIPIWTEIHPNTLLSTLWRVFEVVFPFVAKRYGGFGWRSGFSKSAPRVHSAVASTPGIIKHWAKALPNSSLLVLIVSTPLSVNFLIEGTVVISF